MAIMTDAGDLIIAQIRLGWEAYKMDDYLSIETGLELHEMVEEMAYELGYELVDLDD